MVFDPPPLGVFSLTQSLPFFLPREDLVTRLIGTSCGIRVFLKQLKEQQIEDPSKAEFERAVDLVVMDIFIGVGVAIGLVIGLGLN